MPDQNVQPESSGLTVQDLVLVAQIIQLSSARGIFRAEDLFQIGSLYNRLLSFLESTGAISRNTGTPDTAGAQVATPTAAEPEITEADTAKEKKNATVMYYQD